MKNVYLLILVLFYFQAPSYAQFNPKEKEAELVNIKYYTKDETLSFANMVGGLSTDQTEKLYMLNLQINRKYLTGKNYKQYLDKNSKIYHEYFREKENAYKNVLTLSQYDFYKKMRDKNEEVVSSSNMKIYETGDSGAVEKRISATR